MAADTLGTEVSRGPGTAQGAFDGRIYGEEYLSLEVGEIVTLHHVEEGWAYGTLRRNGKMGWFPPTFWQPMERPARRASGSTSPAVDSASDDESDGDSAIGLSKAAVSWGPSSSKISKRPPKGLAASVEHAEVQTTGNCMLVEEVEELKTRAIAGERQEMRESTCAVCWEEKPMMRAICCGKSFHVGCFQRWLRQRERCPHCQEDLSDLVAIDELKRAENDSGSSASTARPGLSSGMQDPFMAATFRRVQWNPPFQPVRMGLPIRQAGDTEQRLGATFGWRPPPQSFLPPNRSHGRFGPRGPAPQVNIGIAVDRSDQSSDGSADHDAADDWAWRDELPSWVSRVNNDFANLQAQARNSAPAATEQQPAQPASGAGWGGRSSSQAAAGSSTGGRASSSTGWDWQTSVGDPWQDWRSAPSAGADSTARPATASQQQNANANAGASTHESSASSWSQWRGLRNWEAMAENTW